LKKLLIRSRIVYAQKFRGPHSKGPFCADSAVAVVKVGRPVASTAVVVKAMWL